MQFKLVKVPCSQFWQALHDCQKTLHFRRRHDSFRQGAEFLNIVRPLPRRCPKRVGVGYRQFILQHASILHADDNAAAKGLFSGSVWW